MAKDRPIESMEQAREVRETWKLFGLTRNDFFEVLGIKEGGSGNRLYSDMRGLTINQFDLLLGRLEDICIRDGEEIGRLDLDAKSRGRREREACERVRAFNHIKLFAIEQPSKEELRLSREEATRVSIMLSVANLDGHDLLLVQDLCKTLEWHRNKHSK